ncbi:restriction endonuclease subunit S [Escherichia coli]|nr:restriction endonuclease subunit S [Escherichia coli]EJN7553863.1 restriction endonuclease subunit S [Escherichia coli]EKD2533575.1 restriction endonuclease subunit S [Escherichia coli]EKD2538570.1 restriction endonuclease subunit S [Escherichia coli]EKK1342171.1 restriction endonuclease subunit S [Escherichia coli]
MKYRAYSEYKDSCVEWLGEIPARWTLEKFKYLFQVSNEKNGVEPVGQMLSVSGYRGVEVKEYNDEAKKRTLEEVAEYRVVRKGQLVVNTMWLNYSGLGVSDYEGYVSPAYRAYRFTKNVNKKYIHYLLRSNPYVMAYTSQMQGIRPNSLQIKTDDFQSLPVLLPSVVEQECIAKFLDYELDKIDLLIDKQVRLIELLKEKRQAVISDVVRRGLNHRVKLKVSGNEWLGEVPEHWGVSQIGWLCKVGNGSTPNRDNQSYWLSGDYPWLNSSKVNDDIVTNAEQFVTSKALLECSLPLVKKGSVIIAITGEGKTRCTSALLMMDATINQHIAYMTPLSKNKILPEYLHLWLQSKYDQIRFESSGGGSTKAAITCSDVKKYIIPLPPLNEQKVIVADVEEKKRCFNTLVMHCEQQISLLKERRSALISAAVTGKIDVRNWQPAAKDAA